MYANGAFKNPFADFDFSKIAGEFKFPMINVETIVEATRKNFAALTTANTTAVESMKAIAQRQGDMVRAAMEDFSKHGRQADRLRQEELRGRHRQHQGADRALQQRPHRGVRGTEPPRRRADRRGQGCDRQEVIRWRPRRPEKGPLRGPFS